MIALDVCQICGGDRIIETGDRPANGASGGQALIASAVDCACAGGDPADLPAEAHSRWLRVIHPGDPDEPVIGPCLECGPDHYVLPDELCASGCETCRIANLDGEITPCFLERVLP